MGATLHCRGQPSHFGGFSCFKARAPGVQALVAAAHGFSSCGSKALELRLSSCGSQVLVAPQHVESSQIRD